LPSVLLAIFLELDTSNVQDFFLKIEALDYPKRRMHLFIHNAVICKFHGFHVSLINGSLTTDRPSFRFGE
jgi:hypothetical protein